MWIHHDARISCVNLTALAAVAADKLSDGGDKIIPALVRRAPIDRCNRGNLSHAQPPQAQYPAPAQSYPQQYEQPAEYVVVQQPPAYPPPPREVVTVRPAREAVWVQGYWSYSGRGNSYQWVPGHWEIPPGQYRTFVQPRWERQPQGYIYVRGYWR